MGWFSKKKKKVPYVPQGRVGYRRIELGNVYYFTLLVEEIGNVGQRSKVRILEVDVDRDCNRSKEQCLTRWGGGDWLTTDYIHWETPIQRATRLNLPLPQQTYEIDEEELEEEVTYRMTPHNFINNED